MNLSQYLPTDGSGFSDQPCVDIRAHRQTATWVRRLGILVTLVAIGMALLSQHPVYVGAGVLVLVLTSIAEFGLRIQALEWETELADGDGGESA